MEESHPPPKVLCEPSMDRALGTGCRMQDAGSPPLGCTSAAHRVLQILENSSVQDSPQLWRLRAARVYAGRCQCAKRSPRFRIPPHPRCVQKHRRHFSGFESNLYRRILTELRWMSSMLQFNKFGFPIRGFSHPCVWVRSDVIATA